MGDDKHLTPEELHLENTLRRVNGDRAQQIPTGLVIDMRLQQFKSAMRQAAARGEIGRPAPVSTSPPATPEEPYNPRAEQELLAAFLDRLLNSGERGRFALVRKGEPILLWDTLRDAQTAARSLAPGGRYLIALVAEQVDRRQAG